MWSNWIIKTNYWFELAFILSEPIRNANMLNNRTECCICARIHNQFDWINKFVVTVSYVFSISVRSIKIASISCGQNSKKSVHHIAAAIKFKIQYTPNNTAIRPQSEIFIKFVYYSKSLKSPKKNDWISPNHFTTSLITTILYEKKNIFRFFFFYFRWLYRNIYKIYSRYIYSMRTTPGQTYLYFDLWHRFEQTHRFYSTIFISVV